MRLKTDSETGAAYLRIRDGKTDKTVAIDGNDEVFADLDADGNVLGIEILTEVRVPQG